MINARAQNAYGVAHFAQQNHVPQVRWENVDIIGDFIKNQMAKKQLEMMDKNYELAKDQAAFAREKFGYDQERDKVKDGQWEKSFAFNASEADKNRQHAFDLETVRNRNALGQIAARQNAAIKLNNMQKNEMFALYDASKSAAEKRLLEQQKLLSTLDPIKDKEKYDKIAKSFNDDYSNFEETFYVPFGVDVDAITLQNGKLNWLSDQAKGKSSSGFSI